MTKAEKMALNGKCIGGKPAKEVIQPYNWVWCYVKDKKGQFLKRDGRLLVDHKRSGWFENSNYRRIHKRFSYVIAHFGQLDVVKRFPKPIKMPKTRGVAVNYFDYVTL